MNISNEYPVMVFKNTINGKDFYKIGLSKKDIDGNYINGYKSVRFRNGVEIDNMTKIYIKRAWLDFYIKDKKTIDYIFICDFEYEDGSSAKQTTKDPFSDFGETVELDDSFLD